MVTGESGVIDEEYRVEYVADRLETTSTVWLGLTVGCARCHDHKYDPISQREYYQLFAFFNSGVEKGTISPDDPPPVMDVATAAQRAELDALRDERTSAESAFRELAEPLKPAIAAWETKANDGTASAARRTCRACRLRTEGGAAAAPNLSGSLPRASKKAAFIMSRD